jgi:hypothetical protein
MQIILNPIESFAIQYNWLITDCECNYYPDSRIQLNQEYAWLSGDELLKIVRSDDIQFIWAVFSAFPKGISLEDVLQSELPYADGYQGFWQNPVGIQHPLALIEIVPWDSSLVLFITKDRTIIDTFTSHFPLAEDLEKYNAKMGEIDG